MLEQAWALLFWTHAVLMFFWNTTQALRTRCAFHCMTGSFVVRHLKEVVLLSVFDFNGGSVKVTAVFVFLIDAVVLGSERVLERISSTGEFICLCYTPNTSCTRSMQRLHTQYQTRFLSFVLINTFVLQGCIKLISKDIYNVTKKFHFK